MTTSKLALRRAYMDWFRSVDAQLAFTGSLKQSIAAPPQFLTREYVTYEAVERNVRHVIARASRDILGRKFVRQGQSLCYACVIEGLERPVREGGERLHAHLAIGGIPAGFPFENAAAIIERRWRRSRWGYDNNLSSNITSEDARNSWFAYCLKRLKFHNTERYFIGLSPKDIRPHK